MKHRHKQQEQFKADFEGETRVGDSINESEAKASPADGNFICLLYCHGFHS